MAGEYEKALKESKRVATLRPSMVKAAIIWAGAAAALGQSHEAQAALAKSMAVTPQLRIGDVIPRLMTRFARSGDQERFAMLRKAGLPDLS